MRQKTSRLDLQEIGGRLKAYRAAASISADALAKKLRVSRAALYRIEDGYMVRIDVLERIARVLNTSLASLLGAEVEYHANAISYFMRMQQLEAKAERIVAHFNPFSYLLTSESYSQCMRTMLEESIPQDKRIRYRALSDVRAVWDILEERKRAAKTRRPTIVCLVGIQGLERLLDTGLVGRLDLSLSVRSERRLLAQQEVTHLAALMENEPYGVQIGLLEDTVPNVTFQLFYTGGDTQLATSPFELGELPPVRTGIATVTASPEAVRLYEEMFANLWSRALRGREGASRLRDLIRGPAKVCLLPTTRIRRIRRAIKSRRAA